MAKVGSGVVALFSVALAGCGSASSHAKNPTGVQWSYDGEGGPARWGDLDPSFETCATGTQQSPIDLPSRPPRAPFPVPAPPHWDPVPLRVTNDGHFVKFEDTAPSSFVFDGTTYALKQFHFHVPSEHTIDGRAYDAEMHLVHKSADGKVLVIALLFEHGRNNEVLRPMWNAMPVFAREKPIEFPGRTIDVASLMPTAAHYLHYRGSLTAPPCTEGVTWLIVEPDPDQPLRMSDAQIVRIRAIMHGPTARATQPLNGREVDELVP